jgi:uncharacterized protein YraI
MRRYAVAIAAAVAMFTFTADVSEASTYAYAKSGANCRAEPHINAYIISFIPAGAPIEIYGAVGSWYEVDCGPSIGYVHSSLVGFPYAYAPHYVAPKVVAVPRVHRVKPRKLHRPKVAKPRISKQRRIKRAKPSHVQRELPRRKRSIKSYGSRSGGWSRNRSSRSQSSGKRSRRWQRSSELPGVPSVVPAQFAAYVDGVRILTI